MVVPEARDVRAGEVGRPRRRITENTAGREAIARHGLWSGRCAAYAALSEVLHQRHGVVMV
jgi:hypothetical protein